MFPVIFQYHTKLIFRIDPLKNYVKKLHRFNHLGGSIICMGPKMDDTKSPKSVPIYS